MDNEGVEKDNQDVRYVFGNVILFAKIFYLKILGLTKNNEGDGQTFPPANIYLGLLNITSKFFCPKTTCQSEKITSCLPRSRVPCIHKKWERPKGTSIKDVRFLSR